mgnify:CR=1 FL=1
MKRAAAVILTGLVLLCTAGAADPYIGYLYPAGAETGRSIRLLAGGQNLSGVHSGIVSGGGVTVRKVTVVPGFPPPDREQRKYLLQWIKNIETGKPERPPLPEKTDSWRKNPWWEKLDQLDPLSFLLVVRDLHTKRNALQAPPSLRQIVIVDLTVDADARPGVRELRLWGKQGISAPKLFFVDAAPHVPEPEFTAPGKPRPEPPLVSTLPAILDGQVMPGETDRFRLRLAAGKEYTMTLTGRRFQPFIGDAVPGHFQPILRLLDSEGNEAAFADDNYFDPDPVLRFRPSKSGVYTLEIRDNLFRGREDFVYRVLVEPTKRPFRFGVEPFPGLPRLSTETGTVAVDRPAVLAGTLQSSEVKRLNFTGKAGMRVVFDVAARRYGSPLDAVLHLTGPDGKTVAAGNARLMEKLGLAVPAVEGVGTIVHVAVEGSYAGYLLIADVVKPHSAEAIRALKASGVRKTVMLTGDAQPVAQAVAQQLGLDEYHAGLLPGDKVDQIEKLLAAKQPKENLAFVGDGINDAPVLSRADVGIAMGALGSDAAIEAADVVLMDDDPAKIALAMRIARRTLRIVHQNIVFALGIKALCLLLGALGIAGMWAAIFADVGVMVLAVLNATRALYTKDLTKN